MGRKERLIALCRRGQQDIEDLSASLTADERAAQGTADNWSVKDILGHLAHWQGVACQDLTGAEREPVTDENIDRLNGAVFEERRQRTWDEMLAEIRASSEELVSKVAELTEEDLDSTDRFPTQHGRPLWRHILADGHSHNHIHLTNWYATHGQKERGLSLMLEGMELSKELDDSSNWQGTCAYNVACQYALSGDKERALPKLAEALRLNPGLTDWSRKDSDLACLRDEPAYLALYT